MTDSQNNNDEELLDDVINSFFNEDESIDDIQHVDSHKLIENLQKDASKFISSFDCDCRIIDFINDNKSSDVKDE